MSKPGSRRHSREGWEDRFRGARGLDDDLSNDDFAVGSVEMTAVAVTFDEVVQLASHLSRDERSRLVARIGAELDVAQPESTTADSLPGTASAILHVMSELPRLNAEDVDDLERSIAAGRLPVRQEGVFDSEDAE